MKFAKIGKSWKNIKIMENWWNHGILQKSWKLMKISKIWKQAKIAKIMKVLPLPKILQNLLKIVCCSPMQIVLEYCPKLMNILPCDGAWKLWKSIKSFWKCLHSNCTRQKSNERRICPLIDVFGKFHVSPYTDFPEILFLVVFPCKFGNWSWTSTMESCPETFGRILLLDQCKI